MKIDRVMPLPGGTSRPGRIFVALILSLFVAGANWAIPVPAAAESVVTCPTPGVGRAIGPHVSGDETLGSGSHTLEWVGPCGSMNLAIPTASSHKGDFDHFYITLTQPADLEITLSSPDEMDRFSLQVYRGRDEEFRGNYPSCGTTPNPQDLCHLATSGWTDDLDDARELSLTGLAPGTYTVRAIYGLVVEGYYEGRITAFPAGEVRDPEEDSLPDLGPGARGTYPLEPDDEYFDNQWGLKQIKAPQAWQERQATGHGITIAVLDVGLDVGHPDFHCPGKLVLPPGPLPWDENGHGTHVAGIAAACTGNGEGVGGVAPDAAVMPVKIQEAFAVPDLDENMAGAIHVAVDNGAHVINLSYGPRPPVSHLPPEDWYPKTEEAFERARAAGVVVAAAAGNDNQPMCEYPSRSPAVICVGATDSERNVSAYSDLPNNINHDEDGVSFGPSVVAPGGAGRQCNRNPLSGEMIFTRGIVSTYVRTEGDERCGYPNGYSELNGTSMASPHVAGVAALVYDRLGGERTLENGNKVVEAIIETADDSLYAPDYDAFSGYGLVDAWAAVKSIELPEEEEKVADPTPDPAPTGDPTPDPDPSPEPSPSSSDPAFATPHQVTVSPRDAKGRVGTESTLTVTVVDAQGEPLPAIPVEWASVGVGDLVAIEESTDAAGRAVATVVSDEPGDQGIMVWTDSCEAEGRCWDTATRHHGPEICDVFGTRGDDLLAGTAVSEVICGFGGADSIFAGPGADTLIAGSGNDDLRGGAGNDRLQGGRGGDLLIGGRGRDVLSGGAGTDTCRTASGDRSSSCRG